MVVLIILWRTATCFGAFSRPQTIRGSTLSTVSSDPEGTANHDNILRKAKVAFVFKHQAMKVVERWISRPPYP
jgi:hypothetical protein